jgi:hypothetical protein
MNKNQINNIIKLVFNFHLQCDVKWEDQSPDYIKEKWNKYIGTETISNFIDDKYYHLPQLLKNEKINKWIRTWKVSEKDFLEMKEIVYLIQLINSKALIVPEDYDKENSIRMWSLQNLMDEFSKVIDIEKVNKEFYNHQHALIKKEIVKWLNKTENKRAYNLNLLI